MITDELANFIVHLKYENTPENAIRKAKICFLDFLGVSLRGSKEKSSLIAFKVFNPYFNQNLRESEDLVESTIIGHGMGNAIDAGFINGISAHCLDLDDGHRLAQLHPGCVVIPTALALAEERNKTGKEFLEAIIAGYEVAIVLGKLMNPNHRNHGFHSTGTVGTLAAAAAASKILKLNVEETVNALGLAGTQAAGLLESDHAGTMGKHLHAGKAVQSGVISALFAQNGFTGASSILEGPEGFFKALCGNDFYLNFNLNSDLNSKDNDLNRIIEQIKSDLGKFHVQDVYLKKYPVCRHLHSTIDSALDILNEINIHSIENQKINKITVQTYNTAAEHDNYAPSSVEAIRQSLPVALGIALNKGELTLENIEEFETNPEYKPEILEIANKVEIVLDSELDSLQPQKRPSIVSIELKYPDRDDYDKNKIGYSESERSKTIKKAIFLPKGEPENPFSEQEILGKFKSLNSDFNVDMSLIDNLELNSMKNFMGDFFLRSEKSLR